MDIFLIIIISIILDTRLRFDATRTDGRRPTRHQVQKWACIVRLLRDNRDGCADRTGLDPSERPSSWRISRAPVVRDEWGGGPSNVLHARRPIAAGDPCQSGSTGSQQSRVPVGGQPGSVHSVVSACALSPSRSPSPTASPPPRLLPTRGTHDASHFRTRFAR